MQHQPSTVTENGKAPRSDRLYFLDWFRVFAILFVFLIHCSKIFDYHTAVVVNAVRSPVLSAFREFILLWIMPLFFVLSGAAVVLSKGADKPGKFITSRCLRLLVPLIVLGTFVINPLYVYIERLSSGQAAGGFFQWYPHYFEGIYGFGGNFAPLGQGTHLWYLEFLFVYSLLLFPLFVRSKKRGTSVLSRVAIHVEKPWTLCLLFLPISVVAAAFEILGLGGARVMGGWDPLSYLLFFSYGYLLFSNANIGETIKKYYPIYLAVAIMLTALFLDTHFGFLLKIPGLTRHDLLNDGAVLPLNHSLWVAVQALRGFLAWCWILGLLGLGRRFLNVNNRFLAYANEAVLPFYILHHTVIYIIGYYVIPWSGNIGSKFFMIALISLAIIMTMYEILIKRFNVFRFFFGMKITQHSRNYQWALSIVTGVGLVVVMALIVVSANAAKMSPPPTQPGLYVNDEFGVQLTFPTSMTTPGKLSSKDMLFHIKHPENTLFLKVRQSAIPANQPLDPHAAAAWIQQIMTSMGMKNPEVLSTDVVTTPIGTTALYATIQFETKTQALVGMYAFVEKQGKRLFITAYHDGGFEPLEQIVKSLTFK